MDNSQAKTRKRMANFTADEKTLLVQLIKSKPIVESKLNDGKAIAQKKEAWDLITRQFNSNSNVHKRGTLTLKRAWDNMKAITRKARFIERENLLRTPPPCRPQEPSPLQHRAMINTMDTEDTTLEVCDEIQDTKNITDCSNEIHSSAPKITNMLRRPTDYHRREAIIRIRHLKNKEKMDMQILKMQLEVEQIKKRTALLEEERSKILLEKTALELEEVKKYNMKPS